LLKPKIIKGDQFIDHRGELRFVNDFKFEGIKRFYLIKHPDVNFIRAWQGHEFETKLFYPIRGEFVVAWVKIDNFESPSHDLMPEHHIISETNSELVYLPPGYANGIKALEANAELMIFSDMEVEESIKEKTRYESRLWFDWSLLKPLINK
jgi:dTDP-4-dehydrorhamnose 3,5-epimerase-like enzyme